MTDPSPSHIERTDKYQSMVRDTKGRLTNDRVLQTLQQERSELKRQLEDQSDLCSIALERQKKAEAFANE